MGEENEEEKEEEKQKMKERGRRKMSKISYLERDQFLATRLI